MDKHDRGHLKALAASQKRIQAILDKYDAEIARLAWTADVVPGEPFRFGGHPSLKARYDRLIRDLEAELLSAVEDGVRAEWGRADGKNDALAVSVAGSAEDAAALGYIKRNSSALEAFIERRRGGMTLSDRVWQYTGQYSTQIQDAIGIAVTDGTSAAELSREVRQYLNRPDTLFRRVRDEYGVLHLSKNAKAYHPGQGVYRSAYMNARRMAVTEMNMAYRTSDYMRVQQMDFVVGIEVHLSGNHNCKGIPPGQFYDICDELQGKYPKGFKFVGWHPHCRCYTTTILKTREEMKADAKRLKEGKSPSTAESSAQAVTNLPEGFTKWLSRNQQRVATATTLPYFLKDNGRMDGDVWVPFQKAVPPSKPTLLEIAAQRHAARTPEQVQAIKDKWKTRTEAINAAESLKAEYGGILDFDSAKYGGYEGKWAQYKKAVDAYKAELDSRIAALSLLDNPKKWAQTFSLDDLDKVQAAVEAKLAGWKSMGYSLQKTKDKIEFEIDWIEKNKKYNTWNVASDAYRKELSKVEAAIKWQVHDDEYNKLFAYQATKTTSAFKKHLKAYQAAKASGDEAAAFSALDKANKLVERWEKASAPVRYDRSDIIKLYSDAEKAEYNRLLKEFEDALKADDGDHWGYNTRAAARRLSDYVAKLGELHHGEVELPHIGGKTDDEVKAAISAYLGVKKPKSYTFSSPVGGSFEKGYERILDTYSSKFGIPKDELSLITRYTKGSGFINDYKYKSAGWDYTKSVLSQDDLDELVKILDDYEVAANGILDKMPKYNADTYRGVNFHRGGSELLAELQDCVTNGKEWVCPSMMSTATDISVTGLFGSDMTILIHGKSGVDVRQISHFGGESEVLFRSGSRFKVVSVEQASKNGIARAGCWEVILEEVF